MGFFDFLFGNKGPKYYDCPQLHGQSCDYRSIPPNHPVHQLPFCEFCKRSGWSGWWDRSHVSSNGARYCSLHSFYEGKPICSNQNCSFPTQNASHRLCYSCWKAQDSKERQKDEDLKRKLNRKISPSLKRSYNRLGNTISTHLQKPVNMCSSQEIIDCLIQRLHFRPQDASSFVNSDGVKGALGWIPPIDIVGMEKEGYEWTEFQGAHWFRSLTMPGPWTRFGSKNDQQEQQSQKPQNTLNEPQTVIQNITYNIQDSAISGDLKSGFLNNGN